MKIVIKFINPIKDLTYQKLQTISGLKGIRIHIGPKNQITSPLRK